MSAHLIKLLGGGDARSLPQSRCSLWLIRWMPLVEGHSEGASDSRTSSVMWFSRIASLGWFRALAIAHVGMLRYDEAYHHLTLALELFTKLVTVATPASSPSPTMPLHTPPQPRTPALITKGGCRRLLADVRRLPRVADVDNPYTDPTAVSRDGTIAYVRVAFDAPTEDLPPEDVRRLIETAVGAGGDGLRVALGGDPVRGAQEGGGGPAEGLGLLAALVILVVLFGSLLAASLPLVIAVFAVGTAIGLTVLASHVANVADFTVPLMVLVGLGVGIDYALLVFSRYRAELAAGQPPGRRRGGPRHSGRTVLFAGCTVIVVLLGLVVLGLGSLQGVAVAVALTVLLTMVATLTLLPALLAVFGARLERSAARRAARRDRHAGTDRRDQSDGTAWRRWSLAVSRRPWLAAVLPVLFLLGLAAPAPDLRLGFADAGTDAPSATSRAAYDRSITAAVWVS
ncbi:MMPL family transporter [Plantactinospora sp. DSM 117369]